MEMAIGVRRRIPRSRNRSDLTRARDQDLSAASRVPARARLFRRIAARDRTRRPLNG